VTLRKNDIESILNNYPYASRDLENEEFEMNKKYYQICTVLAVVAMLFVLVSSSASARPFTTDFTGIETVLSIPDPGESAVIDGKLHITGLVNVVEDIADDPRVSGTSRVVINGILDLDDNLSGPVWGSYYLENAGGSWRGTWTGERTTEGFLYLRMEGHGGGGYRGMSAWWNVERLSPDPLAPASMYGYILDPGQ